MSLKEKFERYLQAPVDGHVLGLFRLIFGLLMAYNITRYFQIDLIKNTYFLPRAQFSYDFLEFLKPLPEPVMNALLGLMLVCALLMAVGLFFRPACVIFGSLYLYFFLLDKSLFNNHIYLFILLAFVLACTHADRFLSLRNMLTIWKPAPSRVAKNPNTYLIPRWEIFLIQFHFAMVYFFGGLEKLYPAWLIDMEPMKTMIATFPAEHWMAAAVKHEFMVQFLTYGGLLFDMAIPILLWYKPTRKWALIPIVIFNLTNSQIFDDIGIFPFTMIFASVVFFPTEEVPLFRNLAKRRVGKSKKEMTLVLDSPAWLKKALIGYVVFQLVFPVRSFFLPNPPVWTSVANAFAWRMKIQTRQIEELAFTIQDGQNGTPVPVEINTFINTQQIKTLLLDPRAAAVAAKVVAEEGKMFGVKDPVVKAKIKVRWNGKAPAYLVDPEVDLSKVTWSPFKKMDWVLPPPK